MFKTKKSKYIITICRAIFCTNVSTGGHKLVNISYSHTWAGDKRVPGRIVLSGSKTKDKKVMKQYSEYRLKRL